MHEVMGRTRWLSWAQKDHRVRLQSGFNQLLTPSHILLVPQLRSAQRGNIRLPRCRRPRRPNLQLKGLDWTNQRQALL